MTQQEEKKIIKKVISGDKNAYEQLVLANQNSVYNLALKMMRNTEDALDVSQEVFIKAYQNLSSFRFDAKFSVWLYKMTYNLCIDTLRKNAKMKTVPFENKSDEDETTILEIPDIRYLPENIAARKEIRNTIVESIDELPQKQREILVMREITNLSYEEIADVLKIEPGTVKSRLSRARQKLAEILMKKGTFPDSFRQNKRKEDSPNE